MSLIPLCIILHDNSFFIIYIYPFLYVCISNAYAWVCAQCTNGGHKTICSLNYVLFISYHHMHPKKQIQVQRIAPATYTHCFISLAYVFILKGISPSQLSKWDVRIWTGNCKGVLNNFIFLEQFLPQVQVTLKPVLHK